MKTDDLIALLAQAPQAVPRRSAARRLGLAMALALPLAVLVMLLDYGLRAGLADSLRLAMAWLKILLPACVGVAAFVAVERLGRPGVGATGAWIAMALPVLALWVLGLWVWLEAPPEARPALLWGSTWRTCALSIAAIGFPLFAGAFVVLRSLAPTRPALAGAAAGALAGGGGAAVYALHCPELAAPFLAVWYVLGMALPVAAGALLGPRLLRW